MIFYKSQRRLIEKLKNDPSRTTNGAESFYRDLYCKVVQDQPITNTLDSIFAYLAHRERCLAVGKEGIATDYAHKRKKAKRGMYMELVAGL